MDANEAEVSVAETLGLLGMAQTELGAVGATIARHPSGESVGPRLPSLSLDSSPSSDLSPLSLLGRGGMGIVHLAEQRSLSREVAVKTVLAGNANVARALLREARIAGALEHPNVVPVHALGVDAEGAPLLVMKRVEGVSWRALLSDAEHEAWAPLLEGHGDRLSAHVEILAQVSRALAFAHDRGVVHRDLKPDNVMIGRFGEVYLLDWGVALRLSEQANEPRSIVGTPGYLAPEMVKGDPMLVGAHTDVYLLGATLYEILAGEMPNGGTTPLAALGRALTGDRAPLPPSTPAELARLVDTAMSLDPSARVDGAAVFRADLVRFLASRQTDALVRDANAARTRAEASGLESQEAYRALVEARFALTSALRARPDDPRIRADLDACLHRLVEREIALRSPAGARAHLAEMSDPPAPLVENIERMERAVAEDARVVEEGRRTRVEAQVSTAWRAIGITFLFGTIITAVMWNWLLPTRHGIRPLDVLWVEGAGAIVATIVIIATRRLLFGNQARRRLLGFFLVTGFHVVPLALIGWARGDATFDMPTAGATGLAITVVGTIALLPELWPSIVLHAVLTVMTLAMPERASVVASVFVLVNSLAIVRALWLRGKRTKIDAPA